MPIRRWGVEYEQVCRVRLAILTFEFCKIENNFLSLRNCKSPLYHIGYMASDKKFPRRAEKDIKKLNPSIKRQIGKAILKLQDSPLERSEKMTELN